MTFEEVLKYFGSGYRISVDGGFSAGTPPGWKKQGFVPIHAQLKLEQVTKGELKASLGDLEPKFIDEDL